MKVPRVIITAGHDRSLPSEALAELLRRDGIRVEGVLLVSVLNLRRFRALARQRGLVPMIRRAAASFRLAPRLPRRSHDEGHDPMQAFLERHSIKARGLRRWCRLNGVRLWSVPDLNEPTAIAVIRDRAPDAVFYTGGGILRREFIEAAGRVVNAHAGPLPEVRGMNAAEWAALLGERPEVTVHLIDSGIDTGAVIKAYPYDRSACRSVAALRATAVVRGIEGLRETAGRIGLEDLRHPTSTVHASRQCFIMADALVETLERRLAAGEPGGTG